METLRSVGSEEQYFDSQAEDYAPKGPVGADGDEDGSYLDGVGGGAFGGGEAAATGPDTPFSLVQRNAPLVMGDGSQAQTGAQRPRVMQTGNGRDVSPRDARPHASAEVAEVLHTLLPPVTLRDADGQMWKQYCSEVVSSRDDVYQLQERLDAELIERQARPYGICPVRELLYSQSFDELLRQVTIESPERGLMMLRVRDQLRMTIAVYQTLFQQSTVFGTRRAVMAETMMSASKRRVAELRLIMESSSTVYDLQDKQCGGGA